MKPVKGYSGVAGFVDIATQLTRNFVFDVEVNIAARVTSAVECTWRRNDESAEELVQQGSNRVVDVDGAIVVDIEGVHTSWSECAKELKTETSDDVVDV